ncbi:MAG: Holliday junction branch migration protein RuvA [Gaiellales bacterium]|nr:Holliday junction branch migration protein RuvA [Gaiellales bacterium]
MIERLRGSVVHRDAEGAVIAASGVGFRVEMPALSLRALPPEGSEAQVFTYLHVKEDGLQLFGFASEEERALFLLMLGVTKVGPKLALSVLSMFPPAAVVRALAAGDAALLSSVSGLGRKTAERMILELKDKVVEKWAAREPSVQSCAVGVVSDAPVLARAALQELGLSAVEAEQLVRDLPPDLPVGEMVKQALTRRR